MQYNASNLLVSPAKQGGDSGLVMDITPESAGWKHLSFQVRRLDAGARWQWSTGGNELVIVNLTGTYRVTSTRGDWDHIGGRKSVFEQAAHVLYLPRRTEFTLEAVESGEFAVSWTPTDRDHEPFLVKPESVRKSIRGGDNATRQINDILPPGAPVHKLVLVEVYTPGGNWSSYPPHKHDRHLVSPTGELIEADLEEIYYYKIDRPEGCAFQWVYTDATSPVQQAGEPIDAVLRVGDGQAVLVPEGYHPVTSMPGYTTYYLNVLAGSAQSLANRDDPRYTWAKQAYTRVDNRVPLY